MKTSLRESHFANTHICVLLNVHNMFFLFFFKQTKRFSGTLQQSYVLNIVFVRNAVVAASAAAAVAAAAASTAAATDATAAAATAEAATATTPALSIRKTKKT